MSNQREANQNALAIAIRVWYDDDHGYAPSFRDLAAMTGLALGTVYGACQDLKEQGIITFAPGIARTIKIVGVGT
jgi:DNA-binding transcriptional regulator YhcF (GntR family)